jgi:hypothetical protein
MEQQVWVCGSCRSINQPREKRCYRCRTPRDVAEADVATMPVSGEVPMRADAAATPHFRSSAGLGAIAQVMVLVAVGVVAAVGVMTFLVRMSAASDDPSGGLLGVDLGIALLVLQVGVVVAAVAAWALWMRQVVANVPALGGGYTNVTPQMALIENFIPVANFFRIPAILRDVMTRIEAGGKGDALMIGAWAGFVGAIFLPRLNIFAAFISEDLASVFESAAILGLIAVILQVVAGVLLVLLIQHIEAVVAARAEARVPAA